MKVKIESIRIDGGTQPRVEIDYELVHEYSENIDQLPPVVVFSDGATNWLADGFHRYHAHKKLNLLEIEAEVKQGSKRDAVLYSVGANAQHDTAGKPRKNADKKKSVLMLLNDEEWVKWSDSEIAKQCFVDPKTVASYRSAHTMDFHSMGSDKTFIHHKTGKPTTMNTANIGKSQSSYTAPDEEQGGEEDAKPINKQSTPIPFETVRKRITLAKKYAHSAINQLEMIDKNDKEREEAFEMVIYYINSQRRS